MRALLSLGRLLPIIPIAVVPLASAQAGLFDFLEPARPPQNVVIERPAPMDLTPLAQPLRRVEPARQITIHKVKVEKAPVLDRMKSAALQKDSTLRDGDAVMTQHGIRIYASASQGERHSGEFATLAETKGLSPTEFTALAEIDAHRSEDGWQSKATVSDVVTGRSVVANTELAWKWVRDPKGKLVRYVGP